MMVAPEENNPERDPKTAAALERATRFVSDAKHLAQLEWVAYDLKHSMRRCRMLLNPKYGGEELWVTVFADQRHQRWEVYKQAADGDWEPTGSFESDFITGRLEVDAQPVFRREAAIGVIAKDSLWVIDSKFVDSLQAAPEGSEQLGREGLVKVVSTS